SNPGPTAPFTGAVYFFGPMVRLNRYPSPSKRQRVAISTVERLRVEPRHIWRTTILRSRLTFKASTDDRLASGLKIFATIPGLPRVDQCGSERQGGSGVAGARVESGAFVRENYLDSLGGEDLRAYRAEFLEFVLGQGVDEQLADSRHVAGGGRHDLLPALFGEHRVDEAAVARARLAADPALALEAADDVAQPRQ